MKTIYIKVLTPEKLKTKLEATVFLSMQHITPHHDGTTPKCESDLELADKLYHEGYYLKAADTYRKYIKSQNEENNPSLSLAYLKLGKTLLKGLETKEALTVLFKALELKKKFEQADFRGIAEIVLKIGEAYIQDAQYAEAEKCLDESKEILIEKYGEDDPDMGMYYNLLGKLNRWQGEYLISLTNLQKSIKISESTNPPNSAEIATSFYLMAWVHDRLGDYTEGMNCALKALKIKTEIYGEEHPEMALCYNVIGLINQSQSKYQEALQNHHKALRIRTQFLGEYHQSSASSYNNIGMIQEILGDYSSALENYKKCLKIDAASGKENHPEGAATHCNIGDVYLKRNRLDQALWHYNKALEIRVHAYGEGHPQLSSVYDGIADIHRLRNEFDIAEENLLKSLNIRLNCFGDKNSDVGDSYNHLGDLYSDQKDYSKAFQNYLKSLKIRTSLAEEHGVADCFFQLNILFQEMKDVSLGQSCVTRANQVYTKILGENHQNSRSTNRKLKEAEKARNLLNMNNELKF